MKTNFFIMFNKKQQMADKDLEYVNVELLSKNIYLLNINIIFKQHFLNNRLTI